MKESTAADVLKRWGSNFLKGFGFQLSYEWGGEGDKLTVKDVVHAVRGVFGAIDNPDEIERDVRERITKKFPQLSLDKCEFRDKKTLIADLDEKQRRDYDGKARQKISSADYSLYIEIRETNPTQPFMTRKTLANIVTMSIKGLYKAFKNMVKADDVILLHGAGIEHSKDSKINKLKEALPELGDVENAIKKSRDNSTVWSKLNKMFQRVSKDDDYKSSRECLKAINIWQKFIKQYPTGAALDKKFGTDPRNAFKDFFNEYAEFRNHYFYEKATTADEVFESGAVAVSYDIIRDLFED